MNAENFAEWMRRQGHQVYKTESSYWYNAGMHVLQAFPYHWVIKPSEHELNALMVRQGVLSLRYSTSLDADDGLASYHVVLCSPYNIEALRPQARNGIKRGLTNCSVEQISLDRLADEGWKLQSDTLERQGRSESMTQADWKRICLSAKGIPGFEAWGAIVEGELAASILTTRIDDTCYVPYAQSQTQFLNKHVNNALFYVAVCNMLSREGVKGIFFGLQSLDAPCSTDEFKFRMSFTPKPVRQRVLFNPLLMPLANERMHHLLTTMLKRNPGSYILSKAEGMLRFHLNGKRTLPEQEWPECLGESKSSVLQTLPYCSKSSGMLSAQTYQPKGATQS